MGKRKYRATKIQAVDLIKLGAELGDKQVVVAIDVAKEKFYAAIVTEDRRVHLIVKWIHPVDTRAFLGLIESLASARQVEVVLEPTGVYGDALRANLEQLGVAVFRVSPKRVHDATEIYDGVPSLHDAKAATIIARLHLEQLSERWSFEPEHRRRLAAVLRILDVHEKEVARNRNRLESLLARYWPDADSILGTDSATLLEVLIEFGGPTELARSEHEGRKLMRAVGRNFLAEEKIDALMDSARMSLGVQQLEEERQLVIEIASEIRRHQKAAKRTRAQIERLTLIKGSATEAMSPVVGKTTSAILVAGVGAPTQYECPSAYVKALGLNLKEKSSGKSDGGLHITKRGPGTARRVLYLAVLRLLQRDRVVKAWYSKKVLRDIKVTQKALIALMRKLASALWHVAHGAVFDSSKLFDVTRLGLAQTPEEARPPTSA